MESIIDLKSQVGDALRKAAINLQAKQYIMEHSELFDLLEKAARRYLGGNSLNEAITTVKELNRKGRMATVDYMGESILTISQANDVTNEFLLLIEAIHDQQLKCTVSLDLSHLGLMMDTKKCHENISRMAATAASKNVEVMISAENIERADQVLGMYKNIADKYPNVGITLQAYLHRTAADVEDILLYSGKIRIVKGAFDFREDQAMPRGKELNEVYIRFIKRVLEKGHRCSIATHDEVLIRDIVQYINQEHISPDQYEFEFLLGVQESLLDELIQKGHCGKQYVVYGKEWYLYLCNRLAEHPDNVFQAIIDIAQ